MRQRHSHPYLAMSLGWTTSLSLKLRVDKWSNLSTITRSNLDDGGRHRVSLSLKRAPLDADQLVPWSSPGADRRACDGDGDGR